MKKVLIIKNDIDTIAMYILFLTKSFKEDIHYITFGSLEDARKAATFHPDCDMYILDGPIIGGHTNQVIDSFPKQKIIVISSEEGYVKECQEKGIKAIMETTTGDGILTSLEENKKMFETILNK